MDACMQIRVEAGVRAGSKGPVGSSGVPHSGHGCDAEHGHTLGCLPILNSIRAKSGETGHKEPVVGCLR